LAKSELAKIAGIAKIDNLKPRIADRIAWQRDNSQADEDPGFPFFTFGNLGDSGNFLSPP
jgi:hypothetical protein